MTDKKNKIQSNTEINNFFRLLIFIFFTLLFLFYPGDSFYVKFFSYHRQLFAGSVSELKYQSNKVPYLNNPSWLPEISAIGAYVIDLDTATPIFEKNSQRSFLPASTVKIITALTAVDYFKPDDILTVKKVISEGQVIGLFRGEKLTFENLIYGLLIHSGNDAAYVIADNYPGGQKAFVEKMNQKAVELKMTKSQFKNPAGLDDFGQHTTPFDLSLAGRKLLKTPLLAKTVAIKSITISDVNFEHFHQLSNVNRLLGEVVGLGGIKTGYTEDAGENLVSFYKKNGHQFIIVILKSDDRFTDTINVVNWIDGNVKYIEN